jgi:hypothetical protein
MERGCSWLCWYGKSSLNATDMKKPSRALKAVLMIHRDNMTYT